MADGIWKNIEELQIGDKIISPQKDKTIKFATILKTTNWFCDDIYNILSVSATNNIKQKLYSCSENHLIPILYNKKNTSEWELKHVTPKDILNKSKDYVRLNNKGITCFPINNFYGRENCVIEPYTLGAMLGDGCMTSYYNKSRNLDITTADEEIIKEIEKTYAIISVNKKRGTVCKRYRFSRANLYTKVKCMSLNDELKSVGLIGKKSGDKFIPKEALYSDINYRKRLLAGLIDTDGYRCSQSGYEIITKSKQLAEDIYFLVHSLGGRCRGIRETIKKIKSIKFEGNYYRINFNFEYNIDLPLQVNRKKRKFESKDIKFHRCGIYTLRSEKVSSCQVYGFELDSESHWYVTDNFMVTHNSVFTFQQAKYIDPNFNLDRICFTPEEFLKQIRTAPPGSVVVFDEAFRGLSSKASQSKINKMIIQAMMEMGQRNLVTFIVLPTIFLLELYAAVLRSYALFHVYKDKKGRRAYKIYNFKTKSQLYNFGKKKGFSYAFPKLSVKKVGGRFYNIYAINEEKYRAKKMDSLVRTEVDKKEEIHPIYEQRDRTILITYYLLKHIFPKLRKTEYVDYLEKGKVYFNSDMIQKVGRDYGDFSKEMGEIVEAWRKRMNLPQNKEINNNKRGIEEDGDAVEEEEVDFTPIME